MEPPASPRKPRRTKNTKDGPENTPADPGSPKPTPSANLVPKPRSSNRKTTSPSNLPARKETLTESAPPAKQSHSAVLGGPASASAQETLAPEEGKHDLDIPDRPLVPENVPVQEVRTPEPALASPAAKPLPPDMPAPDEIPGPIRKSTLSANNPLRALLSTLMHRNIE